MNHELAELLLGASVMGVIFGPRLGWVLLGIFCVLYLTGGK